MERFRHLRNVNPIIPQSGRAFWAFHLGSSRFSEDTYTRSVTTTGPTRATSAPLANCKIQDYPCHMMTQQFQLPIKSMSMMTQQFHLPIKSMSARHWAPFLNKSLQPKSIKKLFYFPSFPFGDLFSPEK